MTYRTLFLGACLLFVLLLDDGPIIARLLFRFVLLLDGTPALRRVLVRGAGAGWRWRRREEVGTGELTRGRAGSRTDSVSGGGGALDGALDGDALLLLLLFWGLVRDDDAGGIGARFCVVVAFR